MTTTAVLASARTAVDAAKVQVAALHAELPRWGLVVWTAGNVSQRVVVDPASGPGPDDLLVIKPSGVTYDDLTPDAMVVCDLDGALLEGERSPSVRSRSSVTTPSGAGSSRPSRAHGRPPSSCATTGRSRSGATRRPQ